MQHLQMALPQNKWGVALPDAIRLLGYQLRLTADTCESSGCYQAEKEESSKRAFVNAVTSTVTPSESQLLWSAIDNIRHKHLETVGAISTSHTVAEAEQPSFLSGFDMLANWFDEVINEFNNVIQKYYKTMT